MRVWQEGKKGIYQYEFEYNGVVYRKSAKTRNRGDAVTIMNQRKRELLLGHNNIEMKQQAQTFRVAVHDYMDKAVKLGEWGPDTVRMHNNSLKTLLPYFGGMMLEEINVAHIREYQLQRKSGPSKRTGKQLSNRTINIELSLVRQLLEHHRLWVRLTEGVKSTMLKKKKTIGKALTGVELVRLLQACKDSASQALYPAVLLAIYTGLRSKELRTLKWEQVDFGQRTITVGVTKTEGGSGRVIHFADDTFKLLHERKLSFIDAKSHHYVFPSQRYGLMGKRNVLGGTVGPYKTYLDRPTKSLTTSWYNALRVAMVKLRWHDLRHTCTSILALGGASDATLIEMLGWMSKEMLRVYAHSNVVAKQLAVNNAAATIRETLAQLDESVTVQ